MAKILLDFVFPISVVTPTPAASTAWLKQVCVVAKPKAGQEGNVGTVYECTTMTQVSARTDNVDAQQLFNAGMTKVYVLLSDDLALSAAMTANLNRFWTVLVSSDYAVGTVPAVKATRKIQDVTYQAKTGGTAGNSITVTYADTKVDGSATASVVGNAITVGIQTGVTTAATIVAAIVASTPASALVLSTADVGDETDPQVVTGVTTLALSGGVAATADQIGDLDVGPFDGVVGVSTSDLATATTQAAIENRCAFLRDDANGAKSLFFAFGKLLSNLSTWSNQQYITMPVNDGFDTLGEANTNFDARVSFVITDSEFGNRLALFAAGGVAIAAPYILKNLRLDLQSRTLTWISANQPEYTLVESALLETRLQQDVINAMYINTGLITAGVVNISLVQANFVANGEIDVATPKALWRVLGQMTQTL